MPQDAKSPGRVGVRTGAKGIARNAVAKHTPSPTQLQQPAAPALIRIIARSVRGPTLQERADRAGLRLRWHAVRADAGETLVTGTEYPLLDGAHALAMLGLDPETPVTLRHEGAEYDSFEPVPLRIPAALGAKRAERKAAIAALGNTVRERSAEKGVADPDVPATTQAAPLSMLDAGGAP
jgi:hypothetical protein